jgi:predicted CoA-binding protein
MKTLVVGASTNPDRYAFIAANMLIDASHEVELYGLKKGNIRGHVISPIFPKQGIDTVTLYVGPQNQEPLYGLVDQLKPRRVIFNPGTENPEWQTHLTHTGVEVVEACTLVLLRTGQY